MTQGDDVGDKLKARSSELSDSAELATGRIGDAGAALSERADVLSKIANQSVLRIGAVGDALRQRSQEMTSASEKAGGQISDLAQALHKNSGTLTRVSDRGVADVAQARQALAQAATLAAVHSKARTSESAPVDWTLRKYVRKPKGSPPGTVLPERVKTIFVTPREELVTELAD